MKNIDKMPNYDEFYGAEGKRRSLKERIRIRMAKTNPEATKAQYKLQGEEDGV